MGRGRIIMTSLKRSGLALGAMLVCLTAVGARAQPVVETLGGLGAYVTRTQSEARRTALSSKDMELQTQRYGELYRQLSINSDDGNWLMNLGQSTQTGMRQIDCSKKANNRLANFLGAIFDYKKRRVSVLTMSLVAPGTSTGGADRVLIADYPIIAMERDSDHRCRFQLNTKDLTPYINVRAVDRLRVSFKVRYEKSESVNFTNLLSGISQIATLTSANATDGVVDGVAEIAASGLNGTINNVLAGLSKNYTLGREMMLPLSIDPAYSYDKIVISFGAPANAASYGGIDFRAGPAISVVLNYRPTRFANCRGRLGIKDCVGTFDDIPDILEKRAAGATLDSVLKTDPDAGNLGVRSLFDQITAADLLPSVEQRKAAIAAVCRAAKDPAQFKVYGTLNRLDRLLARYAFLASYSSYVRDRGVNSEECFDEFERKLLTELGPAEYPSFPFPANIDGAVENRAAYVSKMLKNQPSQNSKTSLFGEAGELDIRIPALLEGADGKVLRPEGSAGPAAGAAIEKLIFTLGYACPQHGRDQKSSHDNVSLFGFLQRVKDMADGARVTNATYVPIVVSLGAPDPGQEIALKSLTIAGSLREYFSLLRSAQPIPASEGCFEKLAGEERRAFEAMMSLFEQTTSPAPNP